MLWRRKNVKGLFPGVPVFKYIILNCIYEENTITLFNVFTEPKLFGRVLEEEEEERGRRNVHSRALANGCRFTSPGYLTTFFYYRLTFANA